MRKSSVIMLVISIILLVLGAGLVIYGVYLSVPHSSVYTYGGGHFSYSYRAVWSGPAGAGIPYTEFGRIIFDAGLLCMAVFVILQVHKPHDRELEEKEKKAERVEAQKARSEAQDASFHDAETKEPSSDGTV